jgi:hypothetical protein
MLGTGIISVKYILHPKKDSTGKKRRNINYDKNRNYKHYNQNKCFEQKNK